MRIRSIRPEFWSSEDIAVMDWHTRLVYIGLWSYVDDNGVGRDHERLIVADLFPLDDDLSEASVRVHGALKHLNAAGNITRYTVDGKRYLHITAWDTHQKINRPSGSRYPLPTRDDAEIHGALSEPSVSPQRTPATGEGEKGRRGEEEQCASDDAQSDRFAEFWDLYPKKVSKKRAAERWRSAVKATDPQVIIDGLHRYVAFLNQPGQWQKPKDPDGWLSQERWNDELGTANNVRSIGRTVTDGDGVTWDLGEWG